MLVQPKKLNLKNDFAASHGFYQHIGKYIKFERAGLWKIYNPQKQLTEERIYIL